MNGFPVFDLAGKDWLTEKEAAHYCGVSFAQFRKKKPDYDLPFAIFMGKKQYRRRDLDYAIERCVVSG